MASIFNGLVNGDLVELRGYRTSLSEDHRALMAKYACMSAMDLELRIDHQGEFDSFRQDWFCKAMKFVNLVRSSNAAGRMSASHFISSVEYIDDVLRQRWARPFLTWNCRRTTILSPRLSTLAKSDISTIVPTSPRPSINCRIRGCFILG